MNRTILITGAGGGLGGATADLFAERGWQVFAADIAKPKSGPNIHPLRLDVTDVASCEEAAGEIGAHTPGLGAVINFAGVLEVGRPLVEVPEDKMRLTLAVNVFGTYLVNKTMFPLVRSGGGRIVNISSEAGRMPAAGLSAPYSVSKHAVEAYSDALRRELMFVNVPVIIVQPGAFRTNMTRDINGFFGAARNPNSPFDGLIAKVGAMTADQDAKARDPHELAEVVWKAVNSRRPKVRYAVNHSRQGVILGYLPPRLVDLIMKKALS